MDAQVTRDAFAGVIDHPQLTDQLLARPPFKFILDVVTSVVESTGFLKDQFGKAELSGASADKNSKAEFLEKLIRLLDDGDLSNIKAAKIIAGKDPEDTNLMLQKLGQNAREKMSTTSEEKKPKKSRSSSKDKDKDKDKERSKSKERDKKESSSSKSSSKDAERKSRRSSTSEPSEKKEKKEKRETSKDRESKDKKKEKDKVKEKSKDKERNHSKEPKSDSKKSSSSEKEKKEKKEKRSKLKRGDSMIAINGDMPTDDGYTEEHDLERLSKDYDSPSSTRANHRTGGLAASPVKTDDSGLGDDSPRPPPPADRAATLRQMTAAGRPQTSAGRPGTAAARPAPPKIKKKQLAVIDSKPQPVVELKSEIITDATQTNEVDDDFLVQENDEDPLGFAPPTAAVEVDEEDRGALVQKIMDKKAELEEAVVANADEEHDGDIDVERAKVTLMQNKLQEVTRSAYPLARIFDYAHDDMESMLKELEKWRNESRKNDVAEQNREAAGLGETTKLNNILSHLEQEINEVKTGLTSTKSRIMANNERLRILVANV